MPVSNWSTTAASNGSTLGIDIAEDCAAANINNALREMMAQLKVKLDAIDAATGSPSLDATLTALAGLTTAANQIIYATGVDTFAMTTLSTFMRTVLDDGDAAAARATLGAIGGASATAGANSGTISIPLTASFTLLIQWGSGTLAGNTSSTVTFGTAYSVAPFAVVNGGSTNISNEGDVHNAGGATTTGISIANSAPSSDGYTWLSVGQA